MSIKVGTVVLADDNIIGVPWNTKGVVTAVELNLHCPDLYEVTFGDKVRYLYPREFFVLED